MRNIIIEYNIRDLQGNPTGENPLIFNNKEGYMDEMISLISQREMV